MQLKINNLKFTINLKHIIAVCLTLFVANGILAQEIIDETPVIEKKVDTIKPTTNIKVDGVSAVVGEYIILESDIDKTFLQLKAQGGDPSAISRCQLFGKLLEDKLYAHHAIQDSIVINDAEIRSYVGQQLEQIKQQVGGDMQKVLDFYKKADEQSLRDEMFEINKAQKLGSEMQRKIIDEIEVTPEEVRQFFNKIPKEERPTFGTELKVAQIVIEPKPTQLEIDNVIAKLKAIKKDVEENGANFRSKALFNSDDPGSKKNGGALPPMNRARPRMVKEFREVAFSLQEGEISEPFKTQYGYHIILLEKIRGQEYDVRHILMIPEVAETAIQEAKDKIEETKKNIEEGTITFADAAREVSDEVETKYQGGQLINPATQDYNFELTKMDTEIYVKIQDLPNNEVSEVLVDRDEIGNVQFKILTVTDRIDEHEANYARDYLKIKELALNEKRLNAIAKWQEEKIQDTYIKISGQYRDCDFTNNWLKK
ncbi:periplasmic chaperone for outer membrane proteins SurA [Lacinutrix venerupis]|uniref:peptidylprolyl isomerase n=1 Tax=Lacinutrix venerupis TaxID=1486034 RepID=UPI000EB5014A|nr:peptidylprolyl isomerase [Lacinutrix venerupis]RLJ64248.1 periplasmic chaperone for outer membrane proteins SurA [Lacinutrix venerupis]